MRGIVGVVALVVLAGCGSDSTEVVDSAAAAPRGAPEGTEATEESLLDPVGDVSRIEADVDYSRVDAPGDVLATAVKYQSECFLGDLQGWIRDSPALRGDVMSVVPIDPAIIDVLGDPVIGSEVTFESVEAMNQRAGDLDDVATLLLDEAWLSSSGWTSSTDAELGRLAELDDVVVMFEPGSPDARDAGYLGHFGRAFGRGVSGVIGFASSCDPYWASWAEDLAQYGGFEDGYALMTAWVAAVGTSAFDDFVDLEDEYVGVSQAATSSAPQPAKPPPMVGGPVEVLDAGSEQLDFVIVLSDDHIGSYCWSLEVWRNDEWVSLGDQLKVGGRTGTAGVTRFDGIFLECNAGEYGGGPTNVTLTSEHLDGLVETGEWMRFCESGGACTEPIQSTL